MEDIPVTGCRLLDKSLGNSRVFMNLDVDAYVEGLFEWAVQFRIGYVAPSDDIEILCRPRSAGDVQNERRNCDDAQKRSDRPQGDSSRRS